MRKIAKTITTSKAKKMAWTIFSRFIRKRYANPDGLVKCVTCDYWGPWDIALQAGHFIPGRGNAILYDERGVHPQCYNCNINLKGNWPEYLKFMIERYGQEVVDELLDKKRTVVHMTAFDHLEVYERFKVLFNKL